nr:unnamed protein product [Haemonchus contortus]
MSVMSGLTQNSVENTVEDMVVGEDNRSGSESQVDELTTKLATSFGEARTATEAQEPPVRVPRNERWATEAPEVNLQRTVESILSAVYQRVDSR